MAKRTRGLDVGFGAFKIFGDTGGHTIVSHVSEAAANEIAFEAVGLKTKTEARLICNGVGRHWVGLGAAELGSVAMRLDYDRLTGSPEMKALFYAALGQAGATSRDVVNLTVGVPLGFLVGEDWKPRVAALKSWMQGAHEWTDGKRDRATYVEKVGIISQPHAAYLDDVLLLDGTANPATAVSGEVGVISIGFNTIELLVMEDGQPSRRFAHGEKVGVRRLLESANTALGNAYSLAELDAKLRTGKLSIVNALPVWSSSILSSIERAWGETHHRFSRVVAVGGGVQFLDRTLRAMFGSRLVVPQDEVMSIARGLYKLGVK